MKPIVPGCLAIKLEIGSQGVDPPAWNVGEVKKITNQSLVSGCQNCNEETPRWYWEGAPKGLSTCECVLMRIDPDEEQRDEFFKEDQKWVTYHSKGEDDYIQTKRSKKEKI